MKLGVRKGGGSAAKDMGICIRGNSNHHAGWCIALRKWCVALAYVMQMCLHFVIPLGSKASEWSSYAQAAQSDTSMAWWRESRFGMFVHWGVYSSLAGTYGGKQAHGAGEWIMNRAHIPCAEYREYAKQFNPLKYDADAWVRVAKSAGMRYIVITAKHHDGFALYGSEASSWNVVKATPYGKDLLAPLADACRRHDMMLGFYYSQAQDWNNGGAAGGGKWDKTQERSMDEYIDKIAVPQIRELLTNYGEFPAVLWWDTPADMNVERASKIVSLLKMKPGVLCNNKLGGGYAGDFQTEENRIPVSAIENADWETCMSINSTWGYKSYDNNWKSTTTLIRNLVDIASKGGNYLLNVGPTAEGEIPQPAVERLTEIGRWLTVNGEAVYGTTAGPLRSQPWGRCTKRVGASGGKLYLHVFNRPAGGELLIPACKSKVTGTRLLAGGKKLDVRQDETGVHVVLPEILSDSNATVVVAEYEGALDFGKYLPLPDSSGVIELGAADATINNLMGSNAQLEDDHIGFWTNPRVSVGWEFQVKDPGVYEIELDAATTTSNRFSVTCGGSRLDAGVPATGKYDKFSRFQLGRLMLASGGTQKLTITPDPSRWRAINLRSLKLKPAKK